MIIRPGAGVGGTGARGRGCWQLGRPGAARTVCRPADGRQVPHVVRTVLPGRQQGRYLGPGSSGKKAERCRGGAVTSLHPPGSARSPYKAPLLHPDSTGPQTGDTFIMKDALFAMRTAVAFVYHLLEGGAMNLDCLVEDLEAR